MNKKTNLPPQTICWVPTCANQNYSIKKFYPLPPIKSKMREIWLALATKSTKGVPTEKLFFCEDHFEATSDGGMTINDTVFTQNSKALIPNKNMPDRICRTCNTFIEHKEPFFIMSSTINSDIPSTMAEELDNIITVNPEPLNHLFAFCFKEFVIPTDPIPVICEKCNYRIWLFFAYKKRAIEVEDFLSKDMTPEKYGAMVLCRACPDSCSNFIPLRKDSELGIVLQKMFVNNYSPDVVPLKVCLNCYNLLQKISEFYNNCINTEEIIKRRALLNERLKMNRRSSMARKPLLLQTEHAFSMQVEAENMTLAKLMLQFGHSLKNDLHNTDHWNPICVKLKEQGINHKIPSLITNWKKLTNTVLDKMKNKVPLSELEKLVLQFTNCPSDLTTEFASPNKAKTAESLMESSTTKVENRGVICWNSSAKPSTSKVKNDMQMSDEKPMAKRFKKSFKQNSPSPTIVKRGGRRPPKFTSQEKLLFVESLVTEFNKLEDAKRKGSDVWKSLIETVNKNYMPGVKGDRLSNLWTRLKISARTHEKNGTDPLDDMIWDMLQRTQTKSPNQKESSKGHSGSTAVPPTAIANKPLFSTPEVTLQSEPKVPSKHTSNNSIIRSSEDTGGVKKKDLINNVDEVKAAKRRQIFLAIREQYNELKRTNRFEKLPLRIWCLIFDKMYNEGYQDMSRQEAQQTWVELTNHARGRNVNNPLLCEVRRFLKTVQNDRPQKKKVTPTKKQPYESDVGYNPNNVTPKNVPTKNPTRRSSTSNVSASIDVPINSAKMGDRLKWDPEEANLLLELIQEDLNSMDGTIHWPIIAKRFSSRSKTRRSKSSIQGKFLSTRRKYEKEIAMNIPLTDYERRVKQLVDQMNENEKRVETEKGFEKKLPVPCSPSTTLQSSIVAEEPKITEDDNIETPKEEIKTRKDSYDQEVDSYIDLDSYNYVSLEDIQQSTSYDIPEFKPKIFDDEDQKPDLFKSERSVESDENQVSTSMNLIDIEDNEIDSNEYIGGGGDYVGADDLLEDDDEFVDGT
ncbi:uncharacterized protein LOC114329412 [Diabrotica virgifera virgifera]|uniref:Uncharacterized protein LOC114329412 n=1 Tax=Diabrotica virgifera virgifera TaxID=50390 RepID=A0A6P7FHA5_DIAVI|nr:uncharacterized protein LOC114329412 [Diabrotica virgifera virgifera]